MARCGPTITCSHRAARQRQPGGWQTTNDDKERKNPMSRNLKCLSLLTAMVLFTLSSSNAHALFGEGDTVFDPSNFVRNTVTAAQMIQQVKQMVLQVKNSNNEVQMMLQ